MSAATEETRRTAYRTAFLMGDEGKELFVWVAEGDDPAARRAAVLSLYLQWRRDPDYVFGLMDDLGARVGLPPVWRNGRVLRFLADLSITIYINHPEQEAVLHRTSDLWARVLIQRLRLNQLLFLIRLPFARQVGRAFSGRTLSTALLSELQPPARFFGQTDEERQRFLRCISLVDPDAAVTTDAQLADLVALFRSDILLHRILGALILAIHGASDPAANEHVLDELLPQLEGEAALWALLAFSVPLPTTPASWIPRLERMTRSLVERDRDTLFDAEGLLSKFDIALLPLGLAYGKHGLTMPLIDDLLATALRKDRELGLRIVRGLAAVGFYYPGAVFASLRPHADLFAAPDAAASLAGTLSAMRSIHFDRVDLFLGEMHAPSSLREQIAGAPEPDIVARCINWVGFYNNAVHQALHYPAMRRTILMGGLQALGEARKPGDFIGPYTDAAIDMAARAKFRLIRWTEPTFDTPVIERDATA